MMRQNQRQTTSHYETDAIASVKSWARKMQQPPGIFSGVAKGMQDKISNLIPEKIHLTITKAFKGMTEGILAGSNIVPTTPVANLSLQSREALVSDKIRFYQNTAAAEGAITGAGGILLGLADLPLWLSIKVRMLSEIAAQYGHDTRHFSERYYMLQVLQLQFSSQAHKNKVFAHILDWDVVAQTLPTDPTAFDWRRFQQEYRDYLDIAKLLQLMPGVGAVVGAAVNHQLTQKLGHTAMQAYRLRWFMPNFAL